MNTRNRLSLILPLALAAGLIAAAGCGGDDGNSKTPSPLDVKDGTWAIRRTTLSVGGGSACLDPGGTVLDTTVVCNLQDQLAAMGLPQAGCSTKPGAGTFTVDCAAQGTIRDRHYQLSVHGSGQYTDTTYDLTLTGVSIETNLSQPGSPADTCTSALEEHGTWLSGDGRCGTEAPRPSSGGPAWPGPLGLVGPR